MPHASTYLLHVAPPHGVMTLKHWEVHAHKDVCKQGGLFLGGEVDDDLQRVVGGREGLQGESKGT
jgi:hypothetical protein